MIEVFMPHTILILNMYHINIKSSIEKHISSFLKILARSFDPETIRLNRMFKVFNIFVSTFLFCEIIFDIKIALDFYLH